MSQLVELDPLLVRPLRRPEPTSPKKKPEPPLGASPMVLRTALTIVVVVAGVAFAGRISKVAAQPIVATYEMGREIQHLQREKTHQAAINAQLNRDIAYLKTPAGVEQEARRRGWVKPDEVALSVIVPGHDGLKLAGSRTDPEAKPAKQRLSIAERIRVAVDTCLAVLGGKPHGAKK